MADYDSKLKTWGATGSEYPDGYSYVEGEQPVDEWDNFITHESIENILHLLNVTNRRIESGKGNTHPTNPESVHLSYRTDKERLYQRDSTLDSWVGLLRLDGDTMEGALDMGGYSIDNIGGFTLDSEGDLSGNDLSDSQAGTTLYDSTTGNIPLGALSDSDFTLTVGPHLSGGGTISLGGSVSVELDDDFLLNDGDTLTGELRGRQAEGSRLFTAENTTSGDKLSLRSDSSGVFQLVGYDSSDGSWDYESALEYNPDTSTWSFGDTPNVSGNLIATQTWVNNSADAANADTVDGLHAHELGVDIEEDGSVLVSNATGVDFTGHLSLTSDGDGTVTIDPTHNHDSEYHNVNETVNAHRMVVPVGTDKWA